MESDIKKSIQVLEEGGIILYPTDTVWGLGCDALNKAAIARIFKIKERPKDKSLIVLLAESKDIFEYVAAPHPDIVSILDSFERPTTVIYEGALGFPDNLLHEDGSVAIRVTNDPFCKSLLKRWGKPLVSTSANISGEDTPSTFEMISATILERVDYVIKHRQDDNVIRKSSRLVRIDDSGKLTIIRD